MTFREAYRRDLHWRVLDVLLHIGAAWWLHSFWQWAPDVMLLFIWPHGMITGRRLSEDSVSIRIHQMLHSLVLVFLLWLFVPYVPEVVAMSWFVHCMIDLLTHREVWKRDLRSLQCGGD
jgi:hypothetical protein